MARTLKDAILEHFIIQAIVDWTKQRQKDRGFMNILTGYKTYIIAFAMVALAVLHMLGIDIPGVPPLDLGTSILSALGLITARQGAKNDSAKALSASADLTGPISTPAAKTIIANK